MGFLITIDKQLIDEKYWKGTNYVIVYALDYCTIGICPVIIPEWERKTLYKTMADMLETLDGYIVELDDNIVDFYKIKERDYVVTGHKEFVLLTIFDRNK
jgi:hypothetical protein